MYVVEIPLDVPPIGVVTEVNIISEFSVFGQVIGPFITQVAHMYSGL